ncbi:MAG: Maf family protein [Litorivicinus sp.]
MGSDICLASQSPRRRDLLSTLGLTVDVRPAHIDETPLVNEAAREHVGRLALAKAQAIEHPRPVVAADTIVTVDGLILGKPVDKADYYAMAQRLSGRAHQVMTGWAVTFGDQIIADVEITEVEFVTLTDPMIEAYWVTGEASDKAGGYGIQGPAGVWVRSLRGDYNNVVGLPTTPVAHALAAVGVNPWGLAHAR